MKPLSIETLVKNGFSGNAKTHEPLAPHTYFKIGGPAEILLQPENDRDLELIAEWREGKPVTILGAGSNVLISDEGLRGVVVKTDRLNRSFTTAQNRIRMGAGYSSGAFVREAARAGWGGLEWMVGIPGTVGGMICMNAGTFLGETKDSVVEVELYDIAHAKKRVVALPDLVFKYRANTFIKSTELVTWATFQFTESEPALLQKKIQDLLKRRKDAQPVDLPCCGSVFKNPKEMSAWKVVETLGLRGLRIGDAQISEKHANFIVNRGAAKAADVLQIIEIVQAKAKSTLGIILEPEVKVLATPSDES